MEPNLILITAASICGATGIALLFVGILMAMLAALGNKEYLYGSLIFVFFPVAYFWCFKNRDKAGYAISLLSFGALLFTAFLGLLWFELNRLGLDFWQIMAETKPVH